MSRFWIIGGYGEVGKAAAVHLLKATQNEDEIFLAGRNGDKAAKLAHQLGDPVSAIKVDVNGPVHPNLFAPADIVINTVETITEEWLETMAETGLVFIDVSASDSYLARVQAIFSRHKNKSLCLTEVGTSPGLTNLMAASLAAAHPQLHTIETLIEMGMGKHHGLSATQWFIEALSSTYSVEVNGERRQLRPSEQIISARYDLPKPRKVAAIGVGFSDQLKIAQRHRLHSAQTYVGVAPSWIMGILTLFLKLPLNQFVNRHANALAELVSKLPPMGPTRTSLKTIARDQNGHTLASIEMLGPDQSDLTAKVAALAAHLLRGSTVTGVLSLPDVMSLKNIKSQLPNLEWRETTSEKINEKLLKSFVY